MKGDGEIISKSDSKTNNSMPPLEDCYDTENIGHIVTGYMLVARRVFNMQIKEEGPEHRDNIFHSRCLLGGMYVS